MISKNITGASAIAILNALIAERPEHKEHQVKVSRDFWEEPCSPQEFDALDLEYRTEYGRLVKEISMIWGAPDFVGNWEDSRCPDWADVIEMTHWLRDEYFAFVAFSHHDKEFPMEVVLGVHPSSSLSI